MKYSYYNFYYYNLGYSIIYYFFEIVLYILNYFKSFIISQDIILNKDDITFFCGYGYIPGSIKWNGDSIHEGIGGSEYCVIKLAEELSKTNKVYVYCYCDTIKKINNVYYIPSKLFNFNLTYNNLIAWRLPFINWFIKSNNKKLWVHDASLIPALDFFYRTYTLKYFINLKTKIIAPSLYIYNEIDKFKIYKNIKNIPHGIEKYNSSNKNKRIDNTFIWHVNLNRGLDLFLKNFYKIIDIFPNSKIYICGDNFSYYKKGKKYLDILEKFKENIIFTKKMSHNKLLELLTTIDFFCYTANIAESFSLSTWEAALAGCIPIVFDMGALSEIKQINGIVIENNNIDLLISTVIDLLKKKEKKEKIHNDIMLNIDNYNFSWKSKSLIWEEFVLHP